MYNKLLAIVMLLTLFMACRRQEERTAGGAAPKTSAAVTGQLIADTIIYEVVIRNANPEDPWSTHCLAGLDQKKLIDNVFDMIYSGKIAAYNHDTREKLTPRQVEKIEAEEGFSRDNIGMIQFTEAWYMDPDRVTMTKKVLSMVLGYNYNGPGGERFYKALFSVDLGSS